MLKIFCDYCLKEITDAECSTSTITKLEVTTPDFNNCKGGDTQVKHFHTECGKLFFEKLDAITQPPKD